MHTTNLKSVATMTAIAAAVLLGLAACGERPSAEKDRTGQANPPPMASRDRPTEGSQQAQSTSAGDPAQQAREKGKVVDDAQLTVKVKDALTSDPELKAAAINVDSAGGVITLKGTIDSQAKRTKAEKVTENVEGVRSVRNEMVVVKG